MRIESFVAMKDYLASINYRDTIDDLKDINDQKGFRNLIKMIRKDIKKNKISINRGYYVLGYVEMRAGNLEKAYEYFVKAYNACDNRFLKADILLSMGYLRFIQGNYEEAKKFCYTTLEAVNYNRKAEAFSLLSKIALAQRDYEEAIKYYETGYRVTGQDYLLSELAWVYLRKEDYNKALELLVSCIESPHISDRFDLDLSILFLSKKLNVFVKDHDYSSMMDTYTGKQIAKYNLHEAVNHIKKHLEINKKMYGFRDDEDSFDDCIDIYVLIEKVKTMLDDKYKLNSNLRDVYIIPYPGIGKDGSNFLKVVTIPNSSDILTMYPIHDGYSIEDEETLVKTKK